MKHTKEPWILDYGRIRDDNCNTICGFLGNWTDPQWQADRQRIVECVNCMAGVADPANAIAAAREALEWTLGQADELLGAHTGGPNECAYRERIAHARAALALLEGVQP